MRPSPGQFTLQTKQPTVPYVSQSLVDFLRKNPEWQDATPKPGTSLDTININIGAVSVIRFIQQLANDSSSLEASSFGRR